MFEPKVWEQRGQKKSKQAINFLLILLPKYNEIIYNWHFGTVELKYCSFSMRNTMCAIMFPYICFLRRKLPSLHPNSHDKFYCQNWISTHNFDNFVEWTHISIHISHNGGIISVPKRSNWMKGRTISLVIQLCRKFTHDFHNGKHEKLARKNAPSKLVCQKLFV